MKAANVQLLVLVLLTELTVGHAGQTPSPVAGGVHPQGLTIEVLDNMTHLPGGLAALSAPPIPPENPQTEVKIELGRKLFFDKRLSKNGSMSCTNCHNPEKAYSDGRATAIGLNQKILSRRTPSLLNSAYNHVQFWDGRVKSLEEQALVPMLAKSEMGMTNPNALLIRVRGDPDYRQRFREAFGREANLGDIQRAIAAFERTLITPHSAFDRYAGGDKQALTEQQKRGLILFIGKASCSQCHNGPNFTDNKFHSLGRLPGEHEDRDMGHFSVSKNPADRRAFRTPSLRSATQQSRFMHNGSIASLPAVIDFYNEGGGRGPKSNLLFELHLTDAEQQDLLSFLQALASPVPDSSRDAVESRVEEK
jgi:cytochrome c peroxidase